MEKLTMRTQDFQLHKPKSIEGMPIERLVLTVSDLQPALGIGRAQAYALVNRADFPAIRLGRKILIPRDALLRWLDKQTEQALGVN